MSACTELRVPQEVLSLQTCPFVTGMMARKTWAAVNYALPISSMHSHEDMYQAGCRVT